MTGGGKSFDLTIGGFGEDGYKSSQFYKYWWVLRPSVDTKVSKFLSIGGFG